MSRIWRGLQGHPGLRLLAVLTLIGFAAGLQRGSIIRALIGGGVMLAFFGSMVLYSAWESGAPKRAKG